MKHKLTNFDWIFNKLIVDNNLNFIRVNTEAAAHQCFVAILKNQKQLLADVLQNIVTRNNIVWRYEP